MEKVFNYASTLWSKFSTTGAELVNNIVHNTFGIELGETASLGVLLTATGAGVVVFFLMLKKPSKSIFLIESGQRYSKH